MALPCAGTGYISLGEIPLAYRASVRMRLGSAIAGCAEDGFVMGTVCCTDGGLVDFCTFRAYLYASNLQCTLGITGIFPCWGFCLCTPNVITGLSFCWFRLCCKDSNSQGQNQSNGDNKRDSFFHNISFPYKMMSLLIDYFLL